MQLSEVSNLFGVIKRYYDNRSVLSLFDRLINLLSARDQIDQGSWLQQVAAMNREANSFIQNDPTKMMTDEERGFLEDGPYGTAMPSRVGRMLLYALDENKLRSSSSGEVSFFRSDLADKMQRINTFLQLFADLDAPNYEVPEDKIGIVVKLSDRYFDGDLAQLGHGFEQFGNFINLAVGVTQAEPPKVLYLSTGSALAILICSVTAAYSVISVYSACVLTLRKVVEVSKALATARGAGATIVMDSEKLDEMRDNFLTTSLREQFALINRDFDKEVDPEMRSKLVITSRMMMENIKKGSNITLRTEVSRSLEAVNDDDDENEIVELIEKDRGLQDVLKDVMQALGPLLEIEAPSEPGDALAL